MSINTTDTDEYEAALNLRWDADQRAIKRWQAAHPGNDLVWPDHADMVVWLLEQLDVPKENPFDYNDTMLEAAIDQAVTKERKRKQIEERRYLDQLDTLVKQNVDLKNALKPFAAAVYNDNGDMTITPCSKDDYAKAYFVMRRLTE